MNEYKERYVRLGCSDYASLVVVTCNDKGLSLHDLHFGGDGCYKAWIVNDKALIPEHYKKVIVGNSWLKIYDDETLRIVINGGYKSVIEVYRAGEMGTLIYCDCDFKKDLLEL